ncbi:MAG: hypothetical protein AAF609_14120 [Cyanobacteria bacterium P01_C01_bin.120]
MHPRQLNKLGAIALTTLAATLLSEIGQSQAVHTAYLASGESVTYEGYFLANEDIYASCDVNCDDLDIYLYDAQTEELIESDTLIDASPIVTAPYSGDFWVETVMVTCQAIACETWTDSDEGF